MSGLPAPEQLPTATVSTLSPLLLRLLELHSPAHLQRLSEECNEAVISLPEEDRPSSYEGLLDVARYCIDEAPGWEDSDKEVLIGGHPRIGAKGKISESSKAEQQANVVDEENDKKLARLNFVYETRYPALRFVTYAAGRPRGVIATELEELLGKKYSSLQPPMPIDPESPSSGAMKWAQDSVETFSKASQEWQRELTRGLDALFEIAMDRASKITPDDYVKLPSSSKSESTTANVDQPFDTPFLSLDRFQSLVKSSPLLSTFFELDLPSSFYLVPPTPQQETPRELLATLAAVAVTGGGGGDATRKRVKGLLGGLWGEVADRAGRVTGRETRTGPRPAFGREERLRGEEMEAKGSKSGKVPSSQAVSMGTDLEDAEESLKLATQRLTDVDRNHFIIDEPAMDISQGEGEEEEGEEDFEAGLDRLAIEEGLAVQ
ncbi:hypothetical protein CBS101457_006069 [Exobasidium rhododendri]|nr:hypothetical protein CBS101457_006069 [Exobasidium rhododendri]